MPFDNTPEETTTGDYADASVSESTQEVWITVEVETEHGDTEERAFGFIVIPEEEVPYAKKSEKVQKAAQSSRGGQFNAMEYYVSMLEYQIQETSFGAEDRLRTWLKTEASSELVEELEEEVVPAPLGEEGQEEKIYETVREIMERYANSTDGDMSNTLEQFDAWLQTELTGEDEREGN
jgi:hypothetical protein